MAAATARCHVCSQAVALISPDAGALGGRMVRHRWQSGYCPGSGMRPSQRASAKAIALIPFQPGPPGEEAG
jgi:hypothetical protein